MDNLASTFKIYYDSRKANLLNTLRSYEPIHYIRVIAIVGGYMLLRPYLQKLGAKFQARDHERVNDGNEQSSMYADTPGGRIQVVNEDESDSGEDEEDWGARRRRVQRKERKETKRRMEEGEEDISDAEIEEFLEK